MAVSARIVADASIHSLALAGRVIDRSHLARMTLGEASLEREVLTLFVHQTEVLLPRIRDSIATVVAASAHTLKGSARGVGAWRVAEMAEAVEQAGDAERAAAIVALELAVAESNAAIAFLLRVR